MWVVTNTLNVPPSVADRVVEAFRRALPDMQAFEGFLGMEVWRREDGTLLAISRWTSKEAFSRYPESEAFRRHHAGMAHGGGGGEVVQYEALM